MRSASAWLARASAAAPNSVTVLWWPVLPNGRRSIIAPPLARPRRGRAADGTLVPEIRCRLSIAQTRGRRAPDGSLATTDTDASADDTAEASVAPAPTLTPAGHSVRPPTRLAGTDSTSRSACDDADRAAPWARPPSRCPVARRSPPRAPSRETALGVGALARHPAGGLRGSDSRPLSLPSSCPPGGPIRWGCFRRRRTCSRPERTCGR